MPKWLKSLIFVGRLAYAFCNELRVEKRVNAEVEKQRRIQSERYREASNRAGHEDKK